LDLQHTTIARNSFLLKTSNITNHNAEFNLITTKQCSLDLTTDIHTCVSALAKVGLLRFKGFFGLFNKRKIRKI